MIHKKIVDIVPNIAYSSSLPTGTMTGRFVMVRILIFNGDECLWNVLRECLEGEGYTLIEACNDYNGPVKG